MFPLGKRNLNKFKHSQFLEILQGRQVCAPKMCGKDNLVWELPDNAGLFGKNKSLAQQRRQGQSP